LCADGRIDGEDDLARQFRVAKPENDEQSLALLLFGDFDASSACDLIRTCPLSAG
jgi:hypothetical protein